MTRDPWTLNGGVVSEGVLSPSEVIFANIGTPQEDYGYSS